MVYLTMFGAAYDFYKAIEWGFTAKNIGTGDKDLGRNIFIMIAFVMNFIIVCLMSAFLKFHIMLASNNKTTIENLDKQGKPFVSEYDVGSTSNWRQIFGTNPWLYPFPIYCGSGKPVGDGIYWPKLKNSVATTEFSLR